MNRGQETFSFTDANGNLNTRTKFGYGTFWPSNTMHNAISFPEKPKEPEKPLESDYKNNSRKFDEVMIQYKKDMDSYNEDLINFKISVKLRPYSTFHHLYVVYKDGSREPDYYRVINYLQAGRPKSELQEFFRSYENGIKDNE